MWVGLAALLAPTLMRLANQSWSRDFGAYGPIILATGLWLVWRQSAELKRIARPGSPWITYPLLLASVGGYVFGRAYDFLTLEAGGVYGVFLAIFHSRAGLRAMLKTWFPLLYLAFVIPPPGSVLEDITAPLKQFVSHMATDWLSSWGLPVAREGVTIFVAQYQLLVEDACSGMNSLVGLIAVSLLYIYLMRGSSWVYSVLLLFFVIPVAIIANIIRIMVLVLLTYYGGNDLAQGFLHQTAGLFVFTIALLFIFFVDKMLSFAGARLSQKRA